MKKRIVCLLLAVLMVCACMPPVSAASNEAVEAANRLYALGLFQGVGSLPDGSPNFDLDRAPNRHEAVTMLVRLLGKEEEAKSGTWTTPFTDVASWAKPYVGYAYANGLTNGTSDTTFGGSATVTAAQYITFVLRALGYDSGKDFQWDRAWELSDKIGLTDGRYHANTTGFLREDLAIISADALDVSLKSGDMTLLAFIRASQTPKAEFVDLLAEASATHKQMVESTVAFDGFENYVIEDQNTIDLLSEAEINGLVTQRSAADQLTYDQAAKDVDILFRAFQAAYGAYYYFGEAAFDAAEAELMDWLKGKTRISFNEFYDKLTVSFDFLRDAHFYIADSSIRIGKTIRYAYFYCSGQSFAKDKTGYYKMIGGERWDFVSFSDSEVKMAPSLLRSGELCYAPVLFCVKSDMTQNSTLTLKNAAGETKKQTLVWVESAPYKTYENERCVPDYKLLEENGVSYISIRSFDHSYANGELKDFVASGAQVRDARQIVFDIRGHGGGGDQFGRQWVEGFSGRVPTYNYIYAGRISKLRNATLLRDGYDLDSENYGEFFSGRQTGTQIPNDIPIVVLVDDMCGSAGESMLNYLRTLNNVLIVGSNSAGYQLCGNQMGFYLPNSGITFDFGSGIQFHFNDENVDFKGYEPDVWCDPKDALSAVWNMLEYSGQIDAATANAMRSKTAE